jgi:hypothetical protein
VNLGSWRRAATQGMDWKCVVSSAILERRNVGN